MFLIAVGGILVLLILYTCFININPKKFPPGPLRLPLIGGLYALGSKEPHIKLLKLKKKYGSIMGMYFGNFRGIVLNDYKVIKEAFDMPEFVNRPPFEVATYFKGKKFPGLIWSRDKNFEEQRKFTLKNLKSFGLGTKSMEALILEQLKKLYTDFDSQVGKPIVNKRLFNTAAIGALWTIITGKVHDDDDEEFKDCVDSVNRIATVLSGSGAFYFFCGLCKFFYNISGWKTFFELVTEQKDFISKIIKGHKESFEAGIDQPRDFIEAYFEKMAKTEDRGSNFYSETGEDNLLNVVHDIFMAGTETVDVSLTWCFLLLILHPEVQEKLHNEIDGVIGRVTPPSLDDRNKLPYVEATVLEILRYTSPIPLGGPHEASKDLYLNGYFIPKGTVVLPNFYGVLHDPEIWPEPEVFKPERFLSPDGLTVLRNNPSNFAFGSGKRVCVGESLARDEIFLFMTGLLQRYTFTVDPNGPKPSLNAQIGTTLVPDVHSMIIYKRN